jgi:hypothetical protein
VAAAEGAALDDFLDFVFVFVARNRRKTARFLACALVALGCFVALSVPELGVRWQFRVAYVLLAAGIAWTVEMAWPSVEQRPPKVASMEGEPHPAISPEAAAIERDIRRARRWERKQEQRVRELISLLAEVLLLVLIAFGIGVTGYRMALSKAQNSKTIGIQTGGTTVAPGHGVDSAHARTDKGIPCSTETNSCGSGFTGRQEDGPLLQLEPGLEKDLREFLKRPPYPPLPLESSSPTIWQLSLSWGWVWVAIAALVVVGLVAKKHKEVVPVAGAAGLATEALKHAEELAKMDEKMYWWVLWGFLSVSAVLIVLFVAAACVDLHRRVSQRSPGYGVGDASNENRFSKWLKKLFGNGNDRSESKEDYLSSLGFSVVVLLWVAVMVGYKVPGPVEPTKISRTHESGLRVSDVVPLKPIQRFVRKLEREDGPSTSKRLAEDLASKDWHEGDMLLLLGSTDCRRYQQPGGNNELARSRAREVGDSLVKLIPRPGLKMKVESVVQAERCSEAADLRAVYPFLIRGK